jgi:hypothetical protein
MEAKFVAHGSNDREKSVKLREDILRKPFGSFFTPEELEEEKFYIQVIGVVQKEVIATAVLVPEEKNLKMQRVVVSDYLRNVNK